MNSKTYALNTESKSNSLQLKRWWTEMAQTNLRKTSTRLKFLPIGKWRNIIIRYDLLCIEGIAQALQTFLGVKPYPEWKLVQNLDPVVIKKHAGTESVRHYVTAAVLRGIKFTKSSYNSFIDLQDKLH